jgi:hypothetical protein
MARVETIEMGSPEGVLHPSTVHARVKIFGDGASGPIVQIDTFGSADREIPGKLSQTIQFDRDTGEKLLAILQRTYGSR